MVPAIVVPLAAFPLNPSGKIDMAALPDPFMGSGSGSTPGQEQGAAAAAAAYVAPANQVEGVLQRIWTENLRLGQPISTAADYFVMGGTSLQVSPVTSKSLYSILRAVCGHVVSGGKAWTIPSAAGESLASRGEQHMHKRAVVNVC